MHDSRCKPLIWRLTRRRGAASGHCQGLGYSHSSDCDGSVTREAHSTVSITTQQPGCIPLVLAGQHSSVIYGKPALQQRPVRDLTLQVMLELQYGVKYGENYLNTNIFRYKHDYSRTRECVSTQTLRSFVQLYTDTNTITCG